MLSSEALAAGARQAADDRELLARLLRDGLVQGASGDYERRHPRLTAAFTGDIQGRAFPRRRVNLAIRPRAKKNGRRR